MPVDLARGQAARPRAATAARLTPAWPSATLEARIGTPVTLKCEHLQRTGSFKIRGATNFVAQLDQAARARGLVVASAGNHAQGVALAGSTAGIDVTVVMPATAPLAKVNASIGYGARVVLEGSSLEDARKRATAIAEAEGRIYVPPFDDDAVIAGQGTVGLEIVEQVPDLTEVIVPAGGGGLLAGVAVAVKSLKPSVRVIGVQSLAMDGLARSFAAQKLTSAPAARTIADGAAVAGPSARTFELIQRYVDDVVSVEEEAIAAAILLLVERARFVVEGAGALGVAALLSHAHAPSGHAVVVLSGGNIDVNLLGSIVRHGLVVAGRYQQLEIEVTDTPGELALVTRAVADAGGNILEVEHNREAPDLAVGVALLQLLLEVNGPEHFDDVIRHLREQGLRGTPGSRARLAIPGARRLHDV
ncbi:MAG: threonine ammonia-lyase [Dehalococcoidia bacterium]